MKAVFSFYSQPYNCDVRNHRSNWASIEYEFIVFAYAVSRAKLQFKSVELVTDEYGRDLVKELGIEFDKVVLFSVNPGLKLWAAGKMVAYSMQEEPFCHIDSDAFFNRNLPKSLIDSSVCIQSWDDTMSNKWYTETFSNCIKNTKNQYPFDLFHKCKDRRRLAGCMSLYWCKDVDLNKAYTTRFLDILETDYYKSLPDNFRVNSFYNVLFEQLMMSEEYFQMYGEKHSVLLAESELYAPKNSIGFTHIWGVKGKPDLLKPLITKISHKMPEIYQRTYNFFNFTT